GGADVQEAVDIGGGLVDPVRPELSEEWALARARHRVARYRAGQPHCELLQKAGIGVGDAMAADLVSEDGPDERVGGVGRREARDADPGADYLFHLVHRDREWAKATLMLEHRQRWDGLAQGDTDARPLLVREKRAIHVGDDRQEPVQMLDQDR